MGLNHGIDNAVLRGLLYKMLQKLEVRFCLYRGSCKPANILKFNTLTVVENGSQAVDAAQKDDYDLAIFDLQMPIVSGNE